MPDLRVHRGPHPRDPELFAPKHLPALREATSDLSWLLSRGYNTTSALKLAGDRYALTARQRQAVSRAACSDEARRRRLAKLIEPQGMHGIDELWVDGFNVLLTLEVALGGGPLFTSQDTCLRDIASVHGTYRRVVETEPAVRLLTEALVGFRIGRVKLLLDAPVSNSARLANVLRKVWEARGSATADWEVLLVRDPDEDLVTSGMPVASADSGVLDGATRWVNLAHDIVASRVPGAFWVDLAGRDRV